MNEYARLRALLGEDVERSKRARTAGDPGEMAEMKRRATYSAQRLKEYLFETGIFPPRETVE